MGTGEPEAAGDRRDLTGEETDTHQPLGKDYSRCFSDSPACQPALNVVNLSSSPGWGFQSFSGFPGETSDSETNAFISTGCQIFTGIPFKLNLLKF